jgi:FlaA1/EpsC-like NDP-sugar epimerase
MVDGFSSLGYRQYPSGERMEPALVRLFGLPRRTKRALWLGLDLLMLPVLLWAALAIRYESLDPPVLSGIPFGWVGVALLGACALAYAGVYSSVTRAFDERFLQALLVAVGIIVVVLSVGATMRWLPLPRTVPFIFGFFVFLAVWASRSAVRRGVRVLSRVDVPATRVAIYGAGSAGRQLLAALRSAPEYVPLAFFDDSTEMVGAMVQGLRVLRGSDFARAARTLQLDEVLIALPSASKARRREVIEHIEPSHVRVRTLPGISDLVGGKVSMADVQEVDIGDLLGRDAVPPSPELISRDIRGKRVMVTGGGGSIGSELCRQVLAEQPSLLVVVELNELALYNIDQELAGASGGVRVIPVLGSVLQEQRMTRLMSQYAVDTVYHAAAYKHVPLVEGNPFEGLNNNVLGTWRLARAAIAASVSNFVLISTDKAVRPTSVMGASKRLAELVLQALAAETRTATRFCAVRFGNVLGSSGSVVPLFREQIAKGGPLTVTHPDVTRYFMTIPEAAQLVIQAGAMGQGGDVFVLDMGEPVRIIDLARKMIRLCGRAVRNELTDPATGIEIVFSGLRPGEKLYEELLIGDNVSATEHARIMRAMERGLPLAQLERGLELFQQAADEGDATRAKSVLAELIEGYRPDMDAIAVDAPEGSDETMVRTHLWPQFQSDTAQSA